ncbi:MAG: hypothetical protein IPH43_04225 [Xanthomonadales bacterium]|nr:hypothetical protein [Xanthomonadales bacterium]
MSLAAIALETALADALAHDLQQAGIADWAFVVHYSPRMTRNSDLDQSSRLFLRVVFNSI